MKRRPSARTPARTPPDWRQVRAVYDRAAAGYDERHGDPRATARFRTIEAPQLAIAGAGRVLEIGCGTGRLLRRCRAGLRVGIDLSTEMLRRAPGGLHLACADAHRLPFGDRVFDAILAGKGTFRYLDYPIAFAECARVLRPGGRLAVHQYAARTLSLRSLRARWSVQWLRPLRSLRSVQSRRARRDGDTLHVSDLRELLDPARLAGLRPVRTFLWRSVRVWPYALAVPAWMPGTLWSHCTILFEKRLP